MKIIGESHRKKHEQNKNDYRVSISLHRMGSIGADNGPTFLLMKGTKNRKGYTDAFLERNIAAKGSSFDMTENAYMTDEAWLVMKPKVIKGIHTMPYIECNPQWWLLEIFDVFGSHISGLRALEIR